MKSLRQYAPRRLKGGQFNIDFKPPSEEELEDMEMQNEYDAYQQRVKIARNEKEKKIPTAIPEEEDITDEQKAYLQNAVNAYGENLNKTFKDAFTVDQAKLDELNSVNDALIEIRKTHDPCGTAGRVKRMNDYHDNGDLPSKMFHDLFDYSIGSVLEAGSELVSAPLSVIPPAKNAAKKGLKSSVVDGVGGLDDIRTPNLCIHDRNAQFGYRLAKRGEVDPVTGQRRGDSEWYKFQGKKNYTGQKEADGLIDQGRNKAFKDAEKSGRKKAEAALAQPTKKSNDKDEDYDSEDDADYEESDEKDEEIERLKALLALERSK